MRIALFLVAVLSLSGCVDVNSIMPEKGQAADRSYYLVDTKFRFMCMGNTKECRDMTKIVSSRAELKPIEEAYSQQVEGPNYPVSLALMLLHPINNSYQAKPIGNEGRYYSIPINEQTKIVWETLSSIEQNLFNAEG